MNPSYIFGGAVATQFETTTQDDYSTVADVMNGLRHFKSKIEYIIYDNTVNVLEYRYEL